ncbi:MAG: tetratricopeptide repeat protein, partial [Alteraurantiacibacter sp.]
MDARDAILADAQKAMQAGDFAEGLAAAERVLAEREGDGEALYLAAVAHRYLGIYDKAEDALARLHAAMPEYGRAWQE